MPLPTPDFSRVQPAHERVGSFSAACLYERNVAWNRKFVYDPGTTEQLGCGLPHENNPCSAHTLLKLLYVLIYISFGVIFIFVRHKNLYFVSFCHGFVKML
jgi:hypothetical protein